MMKKEGFTLLEVVVAMTILAAGIMVVFGLFSGSLRLSAGSRDASEAAIYAGQRIEEALLAPNPAEGKEQGSFGEKYRWELSTSIVSHEISAREGERKEIYEEIRMKVTIRWMDGDDELSTEVSAVRWRPVRKNEKA